MAPHGAIVTSAPQHRLRIGTRRKPRPRQRIDADLHQRQHQGSQFTSQAFTDALKARGVAISMDGKGAWRDNVFVERLWRSIKYEEVYLHAYDSVGQAKLGIARYISFYNTARPHSSLDKKTPDEFYFATLPAIKRAA